MTYGPPPEPNASAPGPDGARPAQAPPQGPMPPHPHPQQPWNSPDVPGQPAGTPPERRPSGVWLAASALVLGLAALVIPLLPTNLLAERRFVALPLAVGGLILAVGACTGRRRGKPLAVTAAVVCGLALFLGVWMLAISA